MAYEFMRSQVYSLFFFNEVFAFSFETKVDLKGLGR